MENNAGYMVARYEAADGALGRDFSSLVMLTGPSDIENCTWTLCSDKAWVFQKRENAEIMAEAFKEFKCFILPVVPHKTESGYIIVRKDPVIMGISGDVLMLADPYANHGFGWTFDRDKARIFPTRKEAEIVKDNSWHPNLEIIPISIEIGPEHPAREIEELISESKETPINNQNNNNQNFQEMFENITNQFNGMFGKVASGMCRLTMNGQIAVKCSNGYKTYNIKKGTLTNVTNFCFNLGDEMFFVIPTNHVKVGDIILVQGKPKCVIEADKKVIQVIDFENSEIRQVVPERHIFMGSTYFYGKIVSIFGNMFSNGKGLKNVVKMMMLSQMTGKESGMGGLGQMMAMSMMMGDGGNMFSDMFNFDLDDSEESDLILEDFSDEDGEDPDEEEVPVKKTKKSRKE